MSEKKLIKKIEDRAVDAGKAESTICREIFNNGRYLNNLRASSERTEANTEKFDKYERDNPISPGS